jgi:MFS family permease
VTTTESALPYREVLRRFPDFRRLWLGSSISALGDGMTWTALSWLVLTRHGVVALGVLAVCSTAPVLLGGAVLGPLLDRFDKRRLLLVDSLFRAAVIGLVPLLAALDALPALALYGVAATYGLLKMLPLAGVPAAMPDLLPPAQLSAGNGLEQLGYGLATVVGPALAGVLVPVIGAPRVLLLDALSYLVFVAFLARMTRPLPPVPTTGTRQAGWRPAARTVVKDKVILATTLAFMAFNVAEGMLLVTLPWLANRDGEASQLGLLLASIAAGELIGATAAGRVRSDARLLRGIAAAQLVASVLFLAVLAPSPYVIALLLLALGAISAPMTVWAQSLRMLRLPAEERGRIFTLLRTCMQFTPPLGAAIATTLLAGGSLAAVAVTMVLVAGLPALLLLLPADSH